MSYDCQFQGGDAAYLVDREGRIADWNLEAERVFGRRRAEVLGRPCHEVLACRDAQGKENTEATCPVLAAVHAGRSMAGMEVELQLRNDFRQLFRASAVGLGGAEPGTLVLLQATARSLADPLFPASMASIGAVGEDHSLDLHAVMERLARLFKADAAELFLRAPWGDDLLLAVHAGSSARAFRTQTRFAPGEGFPGIVSKTVKPLVCEDLAGDDRYLRKEVVRKGFHGYVCVPILGQEYLGSLHLAFRRDCQLAAARLPLLIEAAQQLGMAIERERWLVSAPLRSFAFTLERSPQANLTAASDLVLQTLMTVTKADGGLLLMAEEPGGTLSLASESNMPASACRAVAPGIPSGQCGAFCRDRSPGCLGRCATARSVCRAVTRGVEETICLPIATRVSRDPVAPMALGGLGVGEEPPPASLKSGRAEGLATATDGREPAIVAVATLAYSRPLPFVSAHLGFVHEVVHQAALLLGSARAMSRSSFATYAPSPESCQTRPGSSGLLDIRCLGAFQLRSGGALIPPEAFRRRRSLALLKILLTRYGRPIHRDELLEMLWPEDTEERSDLLNVAVHYLRRALAGASGDPGRFIRTEGHLYSFDVDLEHRLDTREFEQAANDGARLASKGRRDDAFAAYERAMELYRGDLFEEERAGDWCMMKRLYFRERFLAVLRASATLHLQAGDVPGAIACYRRALLADPALEDIHRALMKTLALCGRRTDALRQFDECQQVLARELATVPQSETLQLRDAIARDLVIPA